MDELTQQQKFQDLISRLELSSTGRLSLNGLPMVLMPRHFFRYILREVHRAVPAEVFQKIYWHAGYDGAVSFCESFRKSHSCSPQEAVVGYLAEMSIRGWGHYSIQSIDARTGTMKVVIQDSALVAEEGIPSGNLVWIGAMVGSVAFLRRELEIEFHISVSPAPAAKGSD
jgi:hypothetical protein